MAQSVVSFGRPAVFKSVLDSTDVNSFIDIELEARKQSSISTDTPTGYPNTAVALSTKVKINSTDVEISTTGASVQTIGQLVSVIDDALSTNGSASFLETEKRIRITAAASGSIPIDKIEIGNLVSGLTGTVPDVFTARYLPGVTGGGACYRVSNMATADNPVDAVISGVEVFGSDGSAYAGSVKKSYDRETGVLLIMDDGSTEFASGTEIGVSVTAY